MEELLKALGEQVAAQGQSVSSLRENMNVLTEGLGVLLQDRQAQQAQLAKAEEIAQAKTQEEAIAAKVLALLSSNGNSRA